MIEKILAALIIFVAAPTFAYVQTVSKSGKKILWTKECVVYHINDKSIPTTLDKNSTIAAVRRSIDTWNKVDCSYIQLVDGGTTDLTSIGDSDRSRIGINIVIWREKNKWPHQEKVLALTSIVFDPDTGHIADTDIELNGDFTYSTGDTAVKIDVENSMTHELGHSLGLDHSTIRNSTMFATAPLGETKKRTLHSDDIEGICAIYQLAKNPNNCSLSTVGHQPSSVSSCRITSSNSADFLPVVLFGFALFCLRRVAG